MYGRHMVFHFFEKIRNKSELLQNVGLYERKKFELNQEKGKDRWADPDLTNKHTMVVLGPSQLKTQVKRSKGELDGNTPVWIFFLFVQTSNTKLPRYKSFADTMWRVMIWCCAIVSISAYSSPVTMTLAPTCLFKGPVNALVFTGMVVLWCSKYILRRQTHISFFERSFLLTPLFWQVVAATTSWKSHG